LAPAQGNQIGPSIAYRTTLSFGQFLFNYRSSQIFGCTFFHGKGCLLILTKKQVGLHFGRLWSQAHRVALLEALFQVDKVRGLSSVRTSELAVSRPENGRKPDRRVFTLRGPICLRLWIASGTNVMKTMEPREGSSYNYCSCKFVYAVLVSSML
jgi:hypothetical protein